MTAAEAEQEHLLKAAFLSKPLFKQGFAHHVTRWRKLNQKRIFYLYQTDPYFRVRYDRELQRRRSIKLPPMIHQNPDQRNDHELFKLPEKCSR